MIIKPIVVVFFIVSLIGLTACSNHNKVIIDPHGVDMSTYQHDLKICEEISMQVESKAGGRAVGGAVVGGALGAIVGSGDTARTTGSVGFVTGLVKGSAATKAERMRVIKNCLRNRGYSVLN